MQAELKARNLSWLEEEETETFRLGSGGPEEPVEEEPQNAQVC
jgi:hypothetical protein